MNDMTKNISKNKQIDKQVVSDSEINNLCKIMNIKHSAFLKDRTFTLSYKVEDSKIFVKCILQNTDKSFFYPIESYKNLKENNLSLRDLIFLLLDYIDIYFSEFFAENEEVLIPIDWTEYTFENMKFHLRGQIRNLYREKMADKILDAAESNLR